MIDRSLLVTFVVVAGVVAALDRWLRQRSAEAGPLLALASGPVIVGLLVGRVAAVLQDDPATLRRPFDLLFIRGGVEFWPGVAAAAAMVWVAARREPSNTLERLAELAPFALWGYAAFEATCLVRDGCFGPPSPVGLRPGGHGAPQIPVGVLVAACVAGVGVAVWLWRRRLGPAGGLAVALIGLAGARTAAGFLLPKVTTGLTRPHMESLSVFALTLLWSAGALILRRGKRVRHTSPPLDTRTPTASLRRRPLRGD